MNDITVVTAFFDVGRGRLPHQKYGRVLPYFLHRSVEQYFDYFRNLAKLDNEMIVYTSKDLAERVFNIRKEYKLEQKTKVVTFDSYLPKDFDSIKEKIEQIMADPKYIEKIVAPQMIEYWHSDYVLVNILKSFYVTHAIEKNLIENNLVAWIDFGYCRQENTIPPTKKWNYDFDVEKIHLFNLRDIEKERPIDNIIFTGDVYIQGCHIVAGKTMWQKLRELIFQNLILLLNHNLIDDDQTLLLMAYLTKPELFELKYVDPSDWFIIFKEYNCA